MFRLTPDGTEVWLAGTQPGTGGNFGQIVRYSATTRTQTGVDQAFTNNVADVAFAPDGLFVVVGAWGQGILIRR